MRVTITFADAKLTLAAVHLAPSWLERVLLGDRERHDIAVAVPSTAGGRLWIFDSTGRRIKNRRVTDALEDERAELELAQRLTDQERRRAEATKTSKT